MNTTIVGGGFGGIKTALELARNPKNHITLISDKTDFQYYPALYGTATGRSHLEAWVPLGEIFAGKKNIIVKIDSIEHINAEKKELTGKSGAVYPYDVCVLALGAVTTYFGIKGLDSFAYGIKTADEIMRLKRHLYEDIAINKIVDKHYVVVGGGPTGVELSSALGSYINRLCDRYEVKKSGITIDLIEAAPRILPKMHEKTSRSVHKRLEKLGVRIQTGRAVESATADEIMVSGRPIKSQTVIWTSGVANHPFYKENATYFTFAKNGKIVVDDYMQATKDVFVIGDNAATPYSGLAQTALHDALFVAAHLKQLDKGRTPKKYKAVMPPVVVPVGENWAVVEWKWLRISGWIASLIRQAADVIGYSDILPLGQALGVWHASKIQEDDYFPAEVQK